MTCCKATHHNLSLSACAAVHMNNRQGGLLQHTHTQQHTATDQQAATEISQQQAYHVGCLTALRQQQGTAGTTTDPCMNSLLLPIKPTQKGH